MSKVDYCQLGMSLDLDLNQKSSEELEEKLQPPRKKRKIAELEITEEIFRYLCQVCNETFKKKDLLDRHMFTHTGKVRRILLIDSRKFKLLLTETICLRH